MKKSQIICAITLPIVLTGCFGPSPALRIQDASRLPEPVVQRASTIEVTSEIPAGAAVIGSIEGTSCKNKIWDPAPSNEAALEQLKLAAIQSGAAGVAGVSYREGGVGALVSNCWALITATGTMYR